MNHDDPQRPIDIPTLFPSEDNVNSNNDVTKLPENTGMPEKLGRAVTSGNSTITDLTNITMTNIPTNVPIDGDVTTYRRFLLSLNPIATTVNRAKIQLAWVYGEALNAFLASPHYKHGDYTKLLAEIEMSWTKAYYVRMLAERYTLETALKRASYSDLLREMKQIPDREPKHGQTMGTGDRILDAVDPPNNTRGNIKGKEDYTNKGKKTSRTGRPPLDVTHETVLLRLEEIKGQAIKIKAMNPPNVELADANALYDRIRSETVEINRIMKDVYDIADNWVQKNGAYAPPKDEEENNAS